jgi:hypothetical protein
MKNKTINVTQKDIDQAQRSVKNGILSCNSCPVALAIRRAFKKGCMYVALRPGGTDAISLGPNNIFKAPQAVIDFTTKFDLDESVEPFTFTLEY